MSTTNTAIRNHIATLPPRTPKDVSDSILAINHHVKYLTLEECSYLHHVLSGIGIELCERAARDLMNRTRDILPMVDMLPRVADSTETESVPAPI